jgi:hypothetical protein
MRKKDKEAKVLKNSRFIKNIALSTIKSNQTS